MKDKIKGGKADKLTIEDLAKKYKVSVDKVKEQLEKGIKVELEHTDDKDLAEEIAMDHLSEDLYYYKKLAKMEKKEAKEQTMSGASGSYEAPLFGDVVTKRKIQEMIKNVKQVTEQMDSGVSAGSMYDGPIGTAGASSPMDKTKKKRKDPLKLDEKGKTASITAASTKDMISTKKGFPRFGGPDAKFVEIDAKCKTYPYCNQGNQGQIKLVGEMKDIIKKTAKKYGLTVEQVTDMVMKEALPRGIFDDPGNTSALKSWTDKGPKIDYHIETEEPVHIVTTDDVDIAKLKLLFNRYDIKFRIKEITK